jgi:hypothetical protein
MRRIRELYHTPCLVAGLPDSGFGFREGLVFASCGGLAYPCVHLFDRRSDIDPRYDDYLLHTNLETDP